MVLVSRYVTNLFEHVPDRAIIEPYMPKIRTYKASAGLVVEKIEDWFAGRSLQKTDKKVDDLSARVDALNADFGKSCANFEQVSAMMDKKIAEVKDFVGEIVKKLPQPCKLEVVGGVRKTLVLHFACANGGGTVTTETKDWHQWCKVGFGLIKLGKCVAVAAAGNPMALASGAGAIQDIYKGYKAKDDKDFNTFISQPFLTSAESDKLINQLRAGKFFDKMEYDAQQGSWVLRKGAKADAPRGKGSVLGGLGLGDASTLVGVATGEEDLGTAGQLAEAAAEAAGSSGKAKKKGGGWFGGKKAAGADGSNSSGSGGGGGGDGGATMARVAELEEEVAGLAAEVARLQTMEQRFNDLEATVLKRLAASEKAQRV
jgi:hypothetical protein